MSRLAGSGSDIEAELDRVPLLRAADLHRSSLETSPLRAGQERASGTALDARSQQGLAGRLDLHGQLGQQPEGHYAPSCHSQIVQSSSAVRQYLFLDGQLGVDKASGRRLIEVEVLAFDLRRVRRPVREPLLPLLDLVETVAKAHES